MAKPSLKKKPPKGRHLWPGETGNGRHSVDYETWKGRQKFDPLKAPYSTNAQFNAGIESQVQAQMNPLLGAHKDTRTDAESAHAGRMGGITSMYDTSSAARKAALDRTSAALNNLTVLNSGLSDATREAMAAALRGAQGQADATASELGIASTPGMGQGYADATQANIDLQGLGTAGEFASILGGMGRDIGINEVGRQESSRNELSRFDAILSDLNEERNSIYAQEPGFRDSAREKLMTQELARSGQREQQRLGRAQQQLNEDQFTEQKDVNDFQETLGTRQQRESERSNRTNEGLQGRQQTETERSNRSNEAINQQQVQLQIEQYKSEAEKATDANTIEQLKAKSQRFTAGVELLSTFFTPTKQEQGKNKTKKTYEARVTHGYDAMVKQLQAATGAGDIEARQMILAAVNSGTPYGARWVARANREIQRIKNSRIKKTPKDPRNPSQSPTGPK